MLQLVCCSVWHATAEFDTVPGGLTLLKETKGHFKTNKILLKANMKIKVVHHSSDKYFSRAPG